MELNKVINSVTIKLTDLNTNVYALSVFRCYL